MHGKFKGTVSHTADAVVINGKEIKVYNKMNVSALLIYITYFRAGKRARERWGESRRLQRKAPRV